MSVRVMTWVWEHSHAVGTDRLVLLAIADNASDDGTNSWPSIETLCGKTKVSERTVRRSIRALEELGELVVELQAGGTPGMREDRRPNLYTVRMTGGQSDTPFSRGVTGGPTGGQTARSTGGHPGPQNVPSKEEPSLNRVREAVVDNERLREITASAHRAVSLRVVGGQS